MSYIKPIFKAIGALMRIVVPFGDSLSDIPVYRPESIGEDFYWWEESNRRYDKKRQLSNLH